MTAPALHLQQQILDALKALVIAADTSAHSDVYVDRLDPLPKGLTRAVLIREGEGGETISPGSIKDMQKRELEVTFECALKKCEGVAAAARAFALEVEKLISPRVGNTNILALCSDWSLTASKLTQSGEGEEAVAARELTYTFTYYVRKGAPDTPIRST